MTHLLALVIDVRHSIRRVAQSPVASAFDVALMALLLTATTTIWCELLNAGIDVSRDIDPVIAVRAD